MDLMLWASERGQMLSRTVKGMMMYGSALQQLELLEAPDATLLRLSSAADGKFTCATSLMIAPHSSMVRFIISKPIFERMVVPTIPFRQRYRAFYIAGTSCRRKCTAARRPAASPRTSGWRCPWTT